MNWQIIQFWDTDPAPIYIEELMQSWAAEAAFIYSRYSYASARRFIYQNFDARTLDAYEQCAVPAMQADFFRLCALFYHGGIYVDADSHNAGGLLDLVEKGERGVLFLRNSARVANDFMVVRFSHEPLIEYALQMAIKNIEEKSSQDVWEVTGPGIMTSLFHSADLSKRRLFDGFFIDDVINVRKVVAFKQDLPYKKTEVHWYGNKTIFRQPPERS